MPPPPIEPSINYNSPVFYLNIPPIAILLICMAVYLTTIFIIFLVRYFLKTKGMCEMELCYCGPDSAGCCQCLEACSNGCQCGTPTFDKCLDSCCPKRKLDCVGIILCQCCDSCFCNACCCDGCCNTGSGPCCSYGELNCNCACVQPDFDSVNCCCCQIGTSNYNRAMLDNE